MAALGESHPLDGTFDALEECIHHDVLRLVELAVDEQGWDLDLAQLRSDVPCFQISYRVEF